MAILKRFFQHVPPKNRHFLYRWDWNTFARRILEKTCRFWFRSSYLFVTNCRVLPVWFWRARKLVTLEGWLILPVQSTNEEYLSQFLSDCKVLWMTSEQLVEIFIKPSIFDSSRAICVLLREQNQLLVPSGWGKAQKTSKISQDSFARSHRIDQKRSQQISESYIMPVAGSIFGSLSQTHISKSEFKNEISKSALLDIQVILLGVCGVDSFIPELEHLIEKLLHGLFSKKKPLKSDSCIQIHELKLRSASSAEKNFADEITWITWKTEQNLEMWPFLNSLLEMWVWESGPKIDPATGVSNMPKAFSWNTYFMSNVYAEKCHFTGKSIGDQPRSFANFHLLLLLTSTRNVCIETCHFRVNPSGLDLSVFRWGGQRRPRSSWHFFENSFYEFYFRARFDSRPGIFLAWDPMDFNPCFGFLFALRRDRAAAIDEFLSWLACTRVSCTPILARSLRLPLRSSRTGLW